MTNLQIEKSGDFKGHNGGIYLLMPGRSPQTIISGAGDFLLVEWDLSGNHKPSVLVNAASAILSACITADKKFLALGELKSTLHIIDLQKKEEIKKLYLGQKAIFNISIDESNQVLMLGTGEGKLLGFSIPDFTLKYQIDVSLSSLRCIDIHPYKPIAALSSSDNAIYLFDLNTRHMINKTEAHQNSIFSICWTPDGKYLASASRDAHINIWEAKPQLIKKHVIPAHMQTINALAFSPDGKWLASASRDKEIRIWDTKDWSLLKVINHKFAAHTRSVNALYWSDQNNYLFSAGDDKIIYCWNISEL